MTWKNILKIVTEMIAEKLAIRGQLLKRGRKYVNIQEGKTTIGCNKNTKNRRKSKHWLRVR